VQRVDDQQRDKQKEKRPARQTFVSPLHDEPALFGPDGVDVVGHDAPYHAVNSSAKRPLLRMFRRHLVARFLQAVAKFAKQDRL
jgi:hypothetical protein